MYKVRPKSVPQFGEWDQKSGGSPDYSKVSPQARANKKQHKHDSAHRSLGNEQELGKHREVSPRVRHAFFAYEIQDKLLFSCTKETVFGTVKNMITTPYFACC